MSDPLRIIIVGPGRAGASLGLAAAGAGHTIVGVLGRTNVAARAAMLSTQALVWEVPLPKCDLLIVAVRDDAIGEVAARLAPLASGAAAAVHLSGLASLLVLEPFRGEGLEIGGFHPLQTMPNPEDGSTALEGASVGITALPPLEGRLEEFATSIGAHPFKLDDSARPLYHAAAAAAANYVLTALALAEQMFEAAEVPFAAARPLVAEVVANAFDLGPQVALTGPIARGDVGTVAAQVAALEAVDADLAADFKSFGRATAKLAAAGEEMLEVLE